MQKGVICFLIILVPVAHALVYSNSFNCPDWSDGPAPNPEPGCNGIVRHYDTAKCTDSATHYSQIISSANNPAGDSNSKGWRLWYKGNAHKVDSNVAYSTPLDIHFNTIFGSGVDEVWIRFYYRYEQGFDWERTSVYPDQKMMMLYFDPPGTLAGGNPDIHWYGNSYARMRADGIGQGGGGPGYKEAHGSNIISDGKWNYFEVHFKQETGDGSLDNGVVEAWSENDVTGQIERAVFSDSATFYGHSGSPDGYAPFTHISIPLNTKKPSWPAMDCKYMDIDDIVISTEGRIGSLDGYVPPESYCGDGTCDTGEDCTCSDCGCSVGLCCSGQCLVPECDANSVCDCMNPGTCNAYCDVPVDPIDTVYIFDDSLAPGAVIYSVDPMTISTNSPYSGTHSLEIIDDGRSNNRIQNMQLDMRGLDWDNSYLEFMIQAAPQEYLAVNLWGDAKMPEHSAMLSGGSYQKVRIKMTDFGTQAEFGNYLTEFMVNADWAGQANYIDEVLITSSICIKGDLEPCDGCVSLSELASYMGLWKSSQGTSIADLMVSIMNWKSGC